LLLLDGPLSALDTPTRDRLRVELRQAPLACGIPTIVVTHDRTEALTLGDRIAAIVAGRLHQTATIDDVFNCPATPKPSSPGHITAHRDGLTHIDVHRHTLYAASPDTDPHINDRVLVGIRAEDVASNSPDRPGPPAPATACRPSSPRSTPTGPSYACASTPDSP